MTESKIATAIAATTTSTVAKEKRIEPGFPGWQHTPPTKSDNTLTEQVIRALGADHLLGRGDLAHLHVTVNRGVATLAGHVVRAISKARAEAAARETPGVTAVVNHLVADNELTIEVAQALGYDQQTQREHIQVNVQHGVVYLGGTVTRAQVRAAAAQRAASISQARGIINVIQTPGIALDTDEERFVQPRIGREIYATDGQIGRVQQVVINPHNRRVTAIIVNAYSASEPLQPQQRVLIPISSIRCAPSGALFLQIKEGEAAHFAAFNPLSFDTPAMDWQPPYPYLSANVLLHRHRL